MVTGGSWSVSQSWPVYCQAGAAGRVALIEAAAKKWGVSPDSCVARGGRVVCGKQEISYAELVTLGVTREFSEAELKALPLKADADLRLVGKPVTSLDIANTISGRWQQRAGIHHALNSGVDTDMVLALTPN